MAISRQKKEEILDSTINILEKSPATVFLNFKGLTGEESSQMRTALAAEKTKMTVVKKTLLKLASEKANGLEGTITDIDGEVAIVYSDDLTTPGRLVKEFSKKFKDKIVISGGVFDGKFKDKAEMTEIADIPSLDVLRGMFVNVINTPISQLAVALGQIAEKKESN